MNDTETGKLAEDKIDFCLSKCGDGYCPAMKGQSGYPCIEFICAFCLKPHDDQYCHFCKGSPIDGG